MKSHTSTHCGPIFFISRRKFPSGRLAYEKGAIRRLGTNWLATSTRYLDQCESSRFVKIMPGRCVVDGCFLFPDVKNDIIVHTMPLLDHKHPVARKRRKKRVDFVKQNRAKWQPPWNSSVCCCHFASGDLALALLVKQAPNPFFQD